MCLCLGFSLWKVLKFVVGVVLVLESCVTLCGPVDCSPPGSSVQGISQARILEWVAISFSRGSSWPGDRIHVSCMAGEFFTIEPLRKPIIWFFSVCFFWSVQLKVCQFCLSFQRTNFWFHLFSLLFSLFLIALFSGYLYYFLLLSLGFPCGSSGKESACNAGDMGSIPGLGWSSGEGKGYPLQYFDLENPMGCIVHGVSKSQTWLSDFHFHIVSMCSSEIGQLNMNVE